MEVLFMAKKAEKCDIVAGNSLATISVEKMIRVVRDKQVLLDRDIEIGRASCRERVLIPV